MIERPLSNQRIIDCLNTDYGIKVAKLTFLDLIMEYKESTLTLRSRGYPRTDDAEEKRLPKVKVSGALKPTTDSVSVTQRDDLLKGSSLRGLFRVVNSPQDDIDNELLDSGWSPPCRIL